MVPGRPCRRRRLRLAGGPCDVGAGGPAYDGPGGNAGVLSLTSGFGVGYFHGENADRAWQGLALGCCALTLLAYGYVWWTEGFWQMEKSGMLSFSNALEVFAVLAPGILLLVVGRHLRARHDKFVRNFATSAGVTDLRDE